jgi:hypothetical protein
MRRFAAAVLVAVVAGAGLTACRGDDSSSGSSGADSTAGPSTTVTGGGDAGSSDATAPPNTAGLTPQLSAILDRQKDAVIKITYRHGNDTFTIAQDHDRKAITSGTSMSIVTPARSVDCTDLTTNPTCLQVPEGVTSLVSLGLVFYDAVAQGIAGASEAYPPIKTTSEKIAGRDAVCAQGDAQTFLGGASASVGRVPNGTVRACVDTETGFLLSYTNTGSANDQLIATSVRRATDKDFEPPAPVQGY